MRLTYSLADQAYATSVSLGIFNASIGLARELPKHPGISHMLLLQNSTLSLPEPAEKRTAQTVDTAIRGPWGRLWWDQVGCYQEAGRSKNEWLFLPKGFASFARACPVQLAVYMHDLISVQYRQRYPGTVSRLRDFYYLATHRETMKQASVIFTSTEAVRAEVKDWARRQSLECPPVEIAGYGFPDYGAPPASKKDQILVMARKSPHKRTDLAIAYVERWRKETGFKGRIICAGTLPEGTKIPDDPAWQVAQKPDTGELNEYIRESRVMIHFTELEGFGMPPVESILSGTPVVYSKIPVTSEVMGETGFPFSNETYESFANALQDALQCGASMVSEWAASLRGRHNWNVVTDRIVRAMIRHS